MSAIGFIVDKLHVWTTDRAVIRDFRERSNRAKWTRKQRHDIYRQALKRHHENQNLVREFRL